ncbi:MAG: tRNA1(Val) (adenine(37)-N6)-methyltransferase [Firmicutes bacterium]|nr:tRNA1(Val) (adenine(37)-N6)-methyltransferase [Bacillota bacterium]
MERELHDLMAYEGLKIYQNKKLLSFSIDSILLAHFVNTTPRVRNILDFGTGFAPIPLFLTLKTKAQITGIDIQEQACEYAMDSVRYNHLENQINILCQDIKNAHEVFKDSSFDIITCNPPFFKAGDVKVFNQVQDRTNARHETTLKLEDMILEAKRLLSTNGSLVFIHRVDRLEEIIILLNKHRFHLKRMQYVYPKKGKKALMVLIDAKSNSQTGSMELLEPLFIYNEDGSYTSEVQEIFNYKRG